MVQPLLVSICCLTLATETVRSILKIDDLVRRLIPDCGLDSDQHELEVLTKHVFSSVAGERSIRDLSLSCEFCN